MHSKKSTYCSSVSADFPVKRTVFIPISLATLRASVIFWLNPEVEIANKRSFVLAIASICFEKIYSKPKSLLIDVITDVSVVNAIAGIGALFFLNLLTSSAARCCESEADPPFPQKNNLPPLFKTWIHS